MIEKVGYVLISMFLGSNLLICKIGEITNKQVYINNFFDLHLLLRTTFIRILLFRMVSQIYNNLGYTNIYKVILHVNKSIY